MRIGAVLAVIAVSTIALAQTDVEEEVPDASVPAPSATFAPPPRAHVTVKDGMLLLPGGRFTMGSKSPDAPPNERPAHEETVASFWIDKTEVTVGAYRVCVDQHKCAAPQRTAGVCTFDLGEPELPVNCVRWADADAYCRAVNKRLPREVEWEYAARGTSAVAYPWGGGSSCAYAATLLNDMTGRRCTGQRPAKVGSYPAGASVFGVLDMSGNVEEWTADWYAERVLAGSAPRSGASHTLRGGGWLSAPSASRTTTRDWGSSVEAGANVGLRCARSL